MQSFTVMQTINLWRLVEADNNEDFLQRIYKYFKNKSNVTQINEIAAALAPTSNNVILTSLSNN